MAIPQKELEEAFKLFDCDGDGNITASELKSLIEKVGGNITDGEATALIRQADRDGNGHLDKTEFTKLWMALKQEGPDESDIRKEFTKLDADNSGFITKGGEQKQCTLFSKLNHFVVKEKIRISTNCQSR